MACFLGDYYGQRCHSGRKSSDIFNDYLDLLNGIACVESVLNWQLKADDSTRLALAVRHMDVKLYTRWHQAMWEKRITSATWANFRIFL
jgi:hypothetical protein